MDVLVPDEDMRAATTDDNALYWTVSGGLVRKLSRVRPSTALTLVDMTSKARAITAIAVDPSSVFFTDEGSNESQISGSLIDDGAVYKVPKNGGAWVVLATGQVKPSSIAVDGSMVYWTAQGTDASERQQKLPDGAVLALPLDGGTPTTIAAHQSHPDHVATDGAFLYWVVGHERPVGRPRLTSLLRVPLGGGVPATLATGLFDVTGLVVDATDVYWTTYGSKDSVGGALMKASKAGGTSVTLVAASGDGNYYGLAIDGSSLYWTAFDVAGRLTRAWSDTKDTGSVLKLPLSGGLPTTLAIRQATLGSAIAVDSDSVYWSNRYLGFSVSTVPKGLMRARPK